jgi:hypothetical protein
MTSRSTAQVRARRFAVCWLWVAGLAGASPRAVAQPDARARADALFADGNAAIARDDTATAAARYRAAWELVPDARYALNLGIALSELGRTAAAAEAFTIYLADPACDPAKRPVLEQRLALWRPELGEIILDVAPASAVVEIDGVRPLRSTSGTGVPVAPGSHRVTARAAGHRGGELSLAVAARGRAIAHIALVAVGGAEPGAEPGATPGVEPGVKPGATPATIGRTGGESVGARPWKWIALGAGLAAVAAGSYFGVTAMNRWAEVDDRCPRGECTAPADIAFADDAHRAGTRANIAFGVGGAALVAALLLWRFEPGPRSPSISIAPHTSGGLLCISGRL